MYYTTAVSEKIVHAVKTKNFALELAVVQF